MANQTEILRIHFDQGGKLTPEQIRFHREWRGQKAIVRTVDDLLTLLRG